MSLVSQIQTFATRIATEFNTLRGETVRNTDQGSFTGSAVTKIVRCTQSEYDALDPPDANTLYLTPEE